MMDRYIALMQKAIEVATIGIAAGESPFGAVIATASGDEVCRAHNVVRASCDATAHAEIAVIRLACAKLGTVDLHGHILATTCEPCPMCASAIHWARLNAVVYGASIADAASAGFNELWLPAGELYARGRSGVQVHPGVLHDECAKLFEVWKFGPKPVPY